MEQAAKMLPTPGDDSDMANAKLHGLQNTIDHQKTDPFDAWCFFGAFIS